MAFKGKTIVNSITGQEIKFLQTGQDTNGQLLEMEATYHRHSKEPAAHYHPYQVEDFKVLSGELTVRIDGKVILLKQGESIHIPTGKIHSMWNNTEGETLVNWKVQPALNTDHFLENATGLANDGKTNHSGMPNILRVALLANKYADAFRLSKPPFTVQKILFTLLTPFGLLFGYKSSYKKYID